MKYLFAFFIFLSFCFLSAQDLSGIFEKVSPAVVVIFTEENIVSEDLGKNANTSFNVLGSGFMISDKNVVTAAHVVNVPESIKVQFSDNDIISAKVIVHYKTADIALLELLIPKKNAKTVAFGDSDELKVGNQIFVVGAPFGLGQSLSAGYVSGFKKQSVGTNPFTKAEFVQTDAAINTGNSGGPMFNLKGEVVGVVSHITTKTGGFQGIGFAATSNLTKYLLTENQSPWSGADLFLLTGEKALSFKLPQKSGLLVQRVVLSSRLGQIGVKGGTEELMINNEIVLTGGDIILSFNGIQFDTDNETLMKLGSFAKSLNEKADFEITVFRNGKVITLGTK